MGTFKIAVRKLFRKGDHSLTRIFSLAGGLAFGIILLSEVFYYYSYDSFYPDSNRIFIVHEKYNTSGEASEFATHSYVSGAVGPGLKAEVPGIESATRLNSIGEMEYVTEDNNIYKGHFILADEHLHEVFPRQMISGIPQEILRDPLACMVSTEIAEMMGGDVVGKTIEMPNDYRSVSFYILIKTHQGSHSNIVQKLTDKFNTAMPYGNAEVQSLAAVQVDAYQQQRGFRNAVTSGSIVVLLVTLMGLLGYLNDEITRYRRSLAIRKGNGATAGDVMKIFVKDIVGLTFPCLIAGLAVARLLAGKWLQNFIIQVDLHWWIFLGVGVFVILFTGIVSAWMSLKAARFNPVKALRY